MNRVVATFLLTGVLTALLAVLGLALVGKGYPFGETGLARLGQVADAGAFLPLAAIYSLAAVLMMILPLRAAGFIHTNAATPLHLVATVLLASIAGLAAARAAFGARDALRVLADWRLVFAPAVIGVHLAMSELRRNVLLRSIALVAFIAATLACLFWSFRF